MVLGLPGGRGRTSVPRGHRARGEGPRNLKTPRLEKMPLRFLPRAPPRPLGVSRRVSHHPASSFSPAPQVRHCVPVSVLITALAWRPLCYMRLGPQSTWPPGLCPAGSQAAGAAASVAGSCSPPPPSSAWPGRPGPDLGRLLGPLPVCFPDCRRCTFPTTALLVSPGRGGQGVKSGDQLRPSLTSRVIWGPVSSSVKREHLTTLRGFQSVLQRPLALLRRGCRLRGPLALPLPLHQRSWPLPAP